MNNKRTALRAWIRTHFANPRISAAEVSILAMMGLVVIYWFYTADVFDTTQQRCSAGMFQRDRALLVGCIISLTLLIYMIRQHRVLKREVRNRVAAEHRARRLAYRDVVTGIPNRRYFEEAMTTAIRSPLPPGRIHALFLLDLNGFKLVNDVHGHSAGDALLTTVARRLGAAVRANDRVARLGGDEFAVLALDLANPDVAADIAVRIMEVFDSPFEVEGAVQRICAGIGIALMPFDATTVTEAMRKADIALYRAKAEGETAFRFFQARMEVRA